MATDPNASAEGAEAGYGYVSACIDAGGSAIGMPQLCTEWIGNQVFWLVLTLLAIFFVLSRIALPRIAAVLAERSGTISNDLAAAEELKLKAEAAEAEYTRALNEARSAAQAIAAEARAEIQSELDDALAKADAEIAAKASESAAAIEAIKATSLSDIETIAKDVAGDLVTALGSSADAKSIDAAVTARLKG